MELFECCSWLILPLLLLCIHLPGAVTLKLLRVDVPAHTQKGHEARLLCEFDMEGDILYSVKWYKDDMEFYRYVPNDTPMLQVFKVRGIKVDKKHSNKHQVILKNLNLLSGGTYKCEVSAEAPSFRTKSDFQDMVVVVPPKKVEIIGAQPKYKVGDTVNVTCIAYKSKPAASLTWRVNGKEVTPGYETYGDFHSYSGEMQVQDTATKNMYSALKAIIREFKPVRENNMETSALGLSFEVQPQHISGLTLECATSIGSVYWQEFQERIPVAAKDRAISADNWWSRSTSPAPGKGIKGFLMIISAIMLILCW